MGIWKIEMRGCDSGEMVVEKHPNALDLEVMKMEIRI